MAKTKKKGSGPMTCGSTRKNSTSTSKATSSRQKKPSTSRKRQASDNEESDDTSDGDTCSRHQKKSARKAPAAQTTDDEEPEEPEVKVVDDNIAGEGQRDEEDEDNPNSNDEDTPDGLETKHNNPVPSTKVVKKDSTKDLLLIMTDIVQVKFKVGNDDYTSIKGRWCIPCKNNTTFVAKHGKRKAFFTGGNSSCRQHIRQHYDLYKKKCSDANVPENHWAIPQQLWREMEEDVAQKKK
ncbi:hypothetical protein Hypma_001668 [Hypsizygus marmoreus]|uniref:Uncharacterized protein n=1 Tax=Hypsizygus marmoreus TaxID=39966 RepID=A0A369J5S9_HYPMA|nr:hypothetical protein Hypma_001668 [Hypsizygus marmoreus]